jgi:hypothetical protein
MRLRSIGSRESAGTGLTPRPLSRVPGRSDKVRCARWALIVSLALITCVPAVAQAAVPGEMLGGGSDIPGGSVIELTSGAMVGPTHHMFADNPGTEPIEVEFRADASPGIEIIPELDRFTLQPGASTKDFFSIVLDAAVPPGDHAVTVQLARSDIAVEPGAVTNIPAIGTSFTIRVVGDSATITVDATSAESGRPVDGTLVLAALTGTGTSFEVGRHEGATFTHTVAPGRYRASYTLDGRELAFGEADVAADQTVTIDLDVNTVSFVVVSARPVEEDGRVVVADLSASVDNHLRPIAGNITIQALVFHDGQHVDTATLHQSGHLAIGVTEATLVYRPQAGFQPGAYRFEFEVVTDEFTLRSSTESTFTVPQPSLTDTAFYVAVAIAAGLIAAIGAAVLTIRRAGRRRRGMARDQSPAPPADSTRPATTNRPLPPPRTQTTTPNRPTTPPPRSGSLAPPDPDALSTAAKRHEALR